MSSAGSSFRHLCHEYLNDERQIHDWFDKQLLRVAAKFSPLAEHEMKLIQPARQSQINGLAKKLILPVVLAGFSVPSSRAAEVHCAALPAIYAASATYSLEAAGKSIPVVGYCKDYDYAHFELSDGPCEIEITRVDHQSMAGTRVSPLKFNIPVAVDGDHATFSLSKPDYFIIDIPKLRRLVVIIDPPLVNPPAPSGAGVVNITAAPYAADATGAKPAGPAIQKAIVDSVAGGKHDIVFVPAGVFQVNELSLPSHTQLYLDDGAVLVCSGSHTRRYHKDSQHRDGTWFIYTEIGAKNVKIFGHGTLDGNGQNLIETQNLTNQILLPRHCTGFTLDGPILRDSGLWGCIVACSKEVTIQNTKHLNRFNLTEDDGIDVCNSSQVLVKHSLSIAQDDSFSTKCWDEGTDLSKQWGTPFEPNRSIRFEDCFAWTGCFAFKLGEGFWKPQEDITFKNGVSFDAGHAIGLSHFWGSAHLKHVVFDTIDAERNTRDAYGCSWGRFVIKGQKAPETSGNAYDIVVRNITVRDAGRQKMPISGLSDDKQIVGMKFENILMPGKSEPAKTLSDINAEELKFAQSITVSPKASEASAADKSPANVERASAAR